MVPISLSTDRFCHGARRSGLFLDPEARHALVELRPVSAFAIAQQVFRRRFQRERVDDLLPGPRCRRSLGDRKMQHPPALVGQHDKDKQDAERERGPPSQTWRAFLHNHTQQLIAADFFTAPTVTFRVLFVFVVLAHELSGNTPTLGLARPHGPTGPFASQPERRLGRLLAGGSPSRTVGCCAPTDRSRPLCETHCLRRSSASKGSMRMPWTKALKDGTATASAKSAATTRTRRASASVTAL